MKLRIQGNTLRLRLSRSEVAALGQGNLLEERTDFGAGGNLRYVLECGSALNAELAGHSIHVTVPGDEARRWAASEETGIYGQSGPLRISVEKDFQCITREGQESEAGNYPNPAARC